MADKTLAELFRDNMLFMLDETFEGPAGKQSAYLDAKAGFRQSLDDLSFEAATTPAWPGATTVAAQVNHTSYYLEVVLGYTLGSAPETDWPGSWRVTVADEQEWQELKAGLFAALEQVRAALLRETEPDDDFTSGMLALLAHSAYHLGAVRQLLGALRNT